LTFVYIFILLLEQDKEEEEEVEEVTEGKNSLNNVPQRGHFCTEPYSVRSLVRKSLSTKIRTPSETFFRL